MGNSNYFDWAGFWSSHKDYFDNLDAKYKAQEKAEEEKYKGMTTREVMEARHKELMEQEKNKYHTTLNDTLNTTLGGYGNDLQITTYKSAYDTPQLSPLYKSAYVEPPVTTEPISTLGDFGPRETPEQIMQADLRFKNELAGNEEGIPYPYRDTKGHVTWGYGHMSNKLNEFLRQPWRENGTNRLLTQAEKEAEYRKITQAPVGNYTASTYENITNARLLQEDMEQLFTNDIESRRKELETGIPNYNRMSRPMQNAILEVHYNAGVLDGWPNLNKAARTFDKDKVCSNISRKVQNNNDRKRNEWGLSECQSGYFYE